METIKVEIYWSEKNYCCGWGFEGVGVVMCTNKSFEGLKAEFADTLRFHVESMVNDGEPVPEWLASGDYKIEFTLAVSALLRQAEQFTTMAAISRVTGINQKLLSNYASAVKVPRQSQRDRIVAGLHEIGRQFLSVR